MLPAAIKIVHSTFSEELALAIDKTTANTSQLIRSSEVRVFSGNGYQLRWLTWLPNQVYVLTAHVQLTYVPGLAKRKRP